MTKRETSIQTRMQIMAAAFTIVHKNGFRATGVNEILEGTGLTKGAFYHYFKSKNDLIHAIVDEILIQMIDDLWLGPLSGADDPITRFQEVFRTTKVDRESVLYGCPLNNLAVEMAPVDEEFRRRVEKAYQHWSGGYADILRQGQKRGTVRTDIDADQAGAFIVAAFGGCRARAKNAGDPEELFRCHRQLDRYLETLRPAPDR
jgi:TetR/AcrR family transcriptional repressor of nem operon